ncbi:phasin family protein [Xaviernesmea oryzae]|uniref:Phasin family protein n=1 Tax=Xaviernesmea oryzae TaxID=464029 RepID=A0A1Q9AX57_9HYPH|nr:phasin family protein [Xaviernesmea oryzae]OLP60033.1 phasin family protein [Xaviernesmea oryzae]SEK39302.1 hypothetical protein SAMN04487976_10272 [Xaviernesmea oryzae]
MFAFDEANKRSKETMEAVMRSYASMAKGFQAIAMEAADYSKRSFEEGVAHIERLQGVRSLETVVELQTHYVKSAYEGYIAEASKLGEMYADLARDTYRPYEAPVAKAAANMKAAAAQATTVAAA